MQSQLTAGRNRGIGDALWGLTVSQMAGLLNHSMANSYSMQGTDRLEPTREYLFRGSYRGEDLGHSLPKLFLPPQEFS